jgi:hypothetical protein
VQADEAAEKHLRRFNKSLCGRDAVVNLGRMVLKGVQFSAEHCDKPAAPEENASGDSW